MELNKAKTPEEKNDEYFESFIYTRGSVGMLRVAWAGFCVAFLEFIPLYVDAKVVYHINPWSSKINVLLFVIIIFMAVCYVLTLEKSFIYKHQNFSSVLFACFTVALSFVLGFLCLMIVVIPDGIDWKGTVNNAYCILVIGTYIISLIYNIIWLKKQLIKGFSEERAQKNYLASTLYKSNSMWIIFGFTMAGGVLTGIAQRIFGFGAGVFLVTVFSRLNIEASYSAYLRIKDKRYWEEPPEKPILTKKELRAVRLKWCKRIHVILCCVILYRLSTIEETRKLTQWEELVVQVLIIDLGIVIILWIIKKLRKTWKAWRKKENENNE